MGFCCVRGVLLPARFCPSSRSPVHLQWGMPLSMLMSLLHSTLKCRQDDNLISVLLSDKILELLVGSREFSSDKSFPSWVFRSVFFPPHFSMNKLPPAWFLTEMFWSLRGSWHRLISELSSQTPKIAHQCHTLSFTLLGKSPPLNLPPQTEFRGLWNNLSSNF